MADRSGRLILNALMRAATGPGGAPLHGGKSSPGLFPTTALGRQAAQRCQEEGYLQPAGEPAPGAASPPCTITEKGLAYLLQQRSPREVLEDFVRVLEEREDQLAHLSGQLRQLQQGLEALRGPVAAVLAEVSRPGGELKALYRDFQGDEARLAERVADALENWSCGSGRDCPLPELLELARRECPELSLGAFHDALRQLRAQGRLYLHPWTGPLYELPEPACALLAGHEVAYYASTRTGERPTVAVA